MKKLFAIMICFILLFSMATPIFANTDLENGLKKIDKAGNNIMDVLYKVAYWTILIVIAIMVIKSVVAHDIQSIIKNILILVLAYASLYFVPEILKMVEEIFK